MIPTGENKSPPQEAEVVRQWLIFYPKSNSHDRIGRDYPDYAAVNFDDHRSLRIDLLFRLFAALRTDYSSCPISPRQTIRMR